MHFYAWKSGLKTGMYYLRTKAAANALQFTIDKQKLQAALTLKDENKQTDGKSVRFRTN